MTVDHFPDARTEGDFTPAEREPWEAAKLMAEEGVDAVVGDGREQLHHLLGRVQPEDAGPLPAG